MQKRMSKRKRIALLEARVSELEVKLDALEESDIRRSVQMQQKAVPIHQVMNEWINGEDRGGE